MMSDDEENGLITNIKDHSAQIILRYKRVLQCMLCFVLFVLIILIFPLIFSFNGTVSIMYQPSFEVYAAYISSYATNESVCDLPVQPFLHPPEGKPASVLLGVGDLTDLTSVLQESTRIRIIDSNCIRTYYETPSCMLPSWFKHGLLVKFQTVNDLISEFPGFHARRIVLIVQNPFEAYADYIRDQGTNSNMEKMQTFFNDWEGEQNAYTGLADKITVTIYTNHLDIDSIVAIRNAVPEDVVPVSILKYCYSRKLKKRKPSSIGMELSRGQKDILCNIVSAHWRKEWGPC